MIYYIQGYVKFSLRKSKGTNRNWTLIILNIENILEHSPTVVIVYEMFKLQISTLNNLHMIYALMCVPKKEKKNSKQQINKQWKLNRSPAVISNTWFPIKTNDLTTLFSLPLLLGMLTLSSRVFFCNYINSRPKKWSFSQIVKIEVSSDSLVCVVIMLSRFISVVGE